MPANGRRDLIRRLNVNLHLYVLQQYFKRIDAYLLLQCAALYLGKFS